MTRDAEAYAELFTEDVVLESPLVPPGHDYPRRLAGRDGKPVRLRDYFAPSIVS